MSRIHTEYPDSDPSDRWVAADVLLRQEPDEEEDEEEDDGDGKEEARDIFVAHWTYEQNALFVNLTLVAILL